MMPGYMTLMVSITLVGIGVSITRPYLSLFGTSIVHMSPVELGIFMCVNALGGIAASTWLGRLSDMKTPKKDVMLFSSACAALGYGVFLVLHSYIPLLVVSTILLGFASSVYPQMFAYARESAMHHDAANATVAVTTLRSFFSLAWVIGPLCGAWLLAVFQFNGLFVATGAIFAGVFFIVLFGIERRPSAGIRGSQPMKVFGFLRDRHILTSCVSFAAVYTAATINGLYMPLLVTKTLHAPQYMVGSIVALSAGLEIPIILVLGALAERFGKRKLLLFGSICGTVYYAGVALAQKPWEMLVLQLFCAVFIATSVSIGMSYMQDFLPGALGSATTLYANTSNIGQMAGSLVGGGIAQVLGFRNVFWVCVGLGIISYVFLLRSRSFKASAEAQVTPSRAASKSS